MSRRKQARPIRVNENENSYGSANQTIFNETKSALVETNFLGVRDDDKLLREIDNSPPSCSEDDVLIPETNDLFCANYPEPQTSNFDSDIPIENLHVSSLQNETANTMDNSILFTPSHVTLEVLENTKVAVAQFAASALANGADETSLKNLANLQTSLFSLQNQQIRQIQLIQELQSKLDDRSVSKAKDKNEYSMEEVKEEKTIPQTVSEDMKALTRNDKCLNASKIKSNEVSVDAMNSNIIIDHNHSYPAMEPNTLEMLQKRTQEVLDSASRGILSGNMIDEMALRKLKNFDGSDGRIDPFSKHQCRYCDKIFGSDSALQIHIRSHTGERPFRCNMCSSSFTTKGNLKVHYQRHTQIDAFQLEIMDRFRSPNRVIDFGRSLPHREFNETPITDHRPYPTSMTLRSDATTDNVPYPIKTNAHQEIKIESEISDTSKLQSFIASMEGHFSRHNRRKRTSTSTSWQEAEPKLLSTNQSELMDLSNKPKNCNITDTRKPKIENEENYSTNSKIDETDSDGDQLDLSETTIHKTNMLNLGTKNGSNNPANEAYMNYPYYPHEVDPPSHFINRGLHPMSAGAMFNHLGYAGIRGNTTCNICYKTFACHSALEIHYRSHTKERPYKCRICRRGFSTKGNMKQHMMTHKIRDPSSNNYDKSAPSSPPSSDSGNSFASPNSYSDNVPIRGTADEFYNSKSSYISDGEEGQEIDGDSLSGRQPEDYSIRQESCVYDRVDDAPLLRSYQSSTQIKSTFPLSETIPSSLFHSKTLLDNNPPIRLPQSSPKQSNISSYLDESSTSASSSNNKPSNENSQSTNLKHLCRVCHKNFSSSSAVHIHMRTHTGDRPFVCNVCQKAFTTKGNLKVHMSVHTWTHGVNRVTRQMGPFPIEFPLNCMPFHHSDPNMRRLEHEPQ